MRNVKTVVELPEDIYTVLSVRGFSKERLSKEFRDLFALRCYRDKILPLGKAAELAGFSKWDFIEFLSENGIPVLTHDDINWQKERKAIKELARRTEK